MLHCTRYLAALCLLMILCTSAAQAQRAASREPDPYELVIREALTEYDAGRYIEAKALFEQAHALAPSARTLRGLGLVSYAMRDYVAAAPLLRGALDDSRKPLKPAMASEAKKLLAQAERLIARYAVSLDHAPRFWLDGAETQPSDGVLLVNPGEHQLVVRAEGFEPLLMQLHAQPSDGTPQPLELPLRPVAQPAAEVAEPTAPAPSAREHAATASTTDADRGRVWTWVAAGSSVAFGAAALGLQLSARSAYDDVDVKCRDAACDAERVDRLQDNGRTLQTLAAVSLGVSVASLAAASVLFFIEGPESPTQVAVGPGSVLVRGRF